MKNVSMCVVDNVSNGERKIGGIHWLQTKTEHKIKRNKATIEGWKTEIARDTDMEREVSVRDQV